MATTLRMIVTGLVLLALGTVLNVLALALAYWGAFRQEDGHWGLWMSCKQGDCTMGPVYEEDWFFAFRAFWTAGTLMSLACLFMWFTIRLNTMFQDLLGLPFLPIFATVTFVFLLVGLVIVGWQCTMIYHEETKASYSFYLATFGSFFVLMTALLASCEIAAEARVTKKYVDVEP